MKGISPVSWLVPGSRCLLCGISLSRAGSSEIPPPPICPACYHELIDEEIHTVRRCLLCGRRIFTPEEGVCPWCREDPPPQSRTLVLFSYGERGREVVRQVKLQGRLEWVPWLVRQAWNRLRAAGAAADIMAPAAFNPRRRDIRGQGLYQFSRQLSRKQNSPMGILLKRRKGRPQKELSREDRLENVKGRIRVAAGKGERLEGKRILLLDDVKTTGATVRESVKALRNGGAGEVWVLVWAVDE